MNSSPIGAHNFIWSSIEVVITRRTRNPLALRGPWVRIPPAPPKKHPARVLFYLYEKGLPSKEPHAKNRKACQGSLQLSSTNESGVRALWPSHMRGCCSDLGWSGKPWEGPFMCRLRANFSRLAYPMQDTHIRERKVLQPSSLLLFCLLFLGTALSSIYYRPILEEGEAKSGIP